MRAGTLAVINILLTATAAFAAESMAANDIQANLLQRPTLHRLLAWRHPIQNDLSPDGKMTREPLAHTGYKNNGTWKLTAKGFSTSWSRSKTTCYTVIPEG